MHPLNRLRRHRTPNLDLLVRILHLKLKPPHHTRNRTPEFRTREILPYTRTLAMQEGYLREIRRRSPVPVTRLPSLLISIDPTVRTILVAGLAPEVRAAVDGVGAEYDSRALGDTLPCHHGVADGLADSDGDGREQAQDFLTDAVEEGHGFQVVPGDGMVGGGDDGANFLPQTSLYLRVLAELVAAPG